MNERIKHEKKKMAMQKAVLNKRNSVTPTRTLSAQRRGTRYINW